MPTLTASVDTPRKLVSVTFDETLAPRLAAWRPNLGCTQLPIGATVDAAGPLPRFDTPRPELDDKPWPLGDRKATGRVQGNARADPPRQRRFRPHAVRRRQRDHGRHRHPAAAHRRREIPRGFRPLRFTTHLIGRQEPGGYADRYRAARRFDLARPAAIAQWRTPDDPRAAITTDNLLRMASGLHSTTAGNRTDALYFGGATVDQDAVDSPALVLPGSTFRYANNDTVLALRGPREQTGDDAKALAFPFTRLLWKIGMTHTIPETDWRGDFVMSSQVWTTARDLARLGLLYQNDGAFQGERLLPEGLRHYVTAPSGPQPPACDFGCSATFWLLNCSPGIPADAFGAFGQLRAVCDHRAEPQRGARMARRGSTGARFDVAKFTAEILTAWD